MRRAVPLLVALVPPAAWAYRPFDGTDAAVAANGDLEIEFGPVGYERLAGHHLLVVPALTVNLGFAPGWEAVLEGKQFYALDAGAPRYRLDDAIASLKTVLRPGVLQDQDGPSIASEIGILLPAINGETGAGASAAVIVSQRWALLTLHANAAALWSRAHQPGFFAGLIAEGPETWPVRPVAEVFVEAERGSQATASALAGGIWQVARNLAFDAAVRLATEAGATVAEVRLGLTFALTVGGAR